MMVNKKITQAGPKPQDQNITYNTHAHTHTDRSLHVAVFFVWVDWLSKCLLFFHPLLCSNSNFEASAAAV